LLALAALFAMAMPKVSPAASFNIDFGNNPNGSLASSSYGAAAGQTGVWNGITSIAPTALVDLSGAATGASLSLSGLSNAQLGGIHNNPALNADDYALVGDNFTLFTPQPWSVSITGLQNGAYTLYVYEPANLFTSSGIYTVNGVVQPELGNPAPDSPLQLNVDYAVLSVLITTGTLDIAFDSRGFWAVSGLAGLQLVQSVATPLPASLPLFGTGLAALGWLMRRRKNAQSVARISKA
jgi:hypothetical protein